MENDAVIIGLSGFKGGDQAGCADPIVFRRAVGIDLVIAEIAFQRLEPELRGEDVVRAVSRLAGEDIQRGRARRKVQIHVFNRKIGNDIVVLDGIGRGLIEQHPDLRIADADVVLGEGDGFAVQAQGDAARIGVHLAAVCRREAHAVIIVHAGLEGIEGDGSGLIVFGGEELPRAAVGAVGPVFLGDFVVRACGDGGGEEGGGVRDLALGGGQVRVFDDEMANRFGSARFLGAQRGHGQRREHERQDQGKDGKFGERFFHRLHPLRVDEGILNQIVFTQSEYSTAGRKSTREKTSPKRVREGFLRD